MNKTKLLTPILGLTTISSCMIPLVSCNNKNYGNVTETEWQSAFDEIWDISNSNRNFTAQIKIEPTGDFLSNNDYEYQNIVLDNKTCGLNDDILITETSKKKEEEEKQTIDQSYFINNENLDWYVTTEDDGTYDIDPMSKSITEHPQNIKFIYQLFGIFYGWHNAGEFINNDEGYKFTLVNSDPIKLWISFAFDNTTKKLSKMNFSLDVNMENYAVGTIKAAATLKDYGTTKITSFDQEKFNTSLQKKKCSTVLGTPEVSTKALEWESYKWYAYYFKPTTLLNNEQQYNTISIDSPADGTSCVSIILNGKQLMNGYDFTCEIDSGKKTTITFNFDTVKSTDNLILLVKSDQISAATTPTCKISYVE